MNNKHHNFDKELAVHVNEVSTTVIDEICGDKGCLGQKSILFNYHNTKDEVTTQNSSSFASTATSDQTKPAVIVPKQ